MGVRELWSILEPVGQPVTLLDLQGKTLAIDLSIWILESESIQNIGKPYLRNIFWRVSHLLRNQVTPVFVIEGTPPTLKNAELERRFRGTPRKNFYSAQSHKNQTPRGKNTQFEEKLQQSCQLLDALGIRYVQSDGEAEATCAQLNLDGVVDACVTQDGDAFLFGARTVYRNFTCSNQKVDGMRVYHMKDVEEELGFSRRHLISIALLVGCDYYTGVKAVGKKYAEDFMQEIKGHDPLQKLKELKTSTLYKRLEAFENMAKRRHCLRCQHPGSKDVHQKLGCSLCKLENGCDENKADYVCQCPYHRNKRELDEHTAAMKIRRIVIKDPEFPPQKVMDAFLNPPYSAPKGELEWQKPSIIKIKSFNKAHLRWGHDKVEARLIPLFTAWDLSHPEETSLLPLRILKIFHERGQKMIEVEWKYEDKSLQMNQNDTVTTREHYDVMSDVHPDLVSGFEAEQKEIVPKIQKSPAKRKLMKAAAQSKRIDGFFKQKKPKIETAVKPSELEDNQEIEEKNDEQLFNHSDSEIIATSPLQDAPEEVSPGSPFEEKTVEDETGEELSTLKKYISESSHDIVEESSVAQEDIEEKISLSSQSDKEPLLNEPTADASEGAHSVASTLTNQGDSNVIPVPKTEPEQCPTREDPRQQRGPVKYPRSEEQSGGSDDELKLFLETNSDSNDPAEPSPGHQAEKEASPGVESEKKKVTVRRLRSRNVFNIFKETQENIAANPKESPQHNKADVAPKLGRQCSDRPYVSYITNGKTKMNRVLQIRLEKVDAKAIFQRTCKPSNDSNENHNESLCKGDMNGEVPSSSESGANKYHIVGETTLGSPERNSTALQHEDSADSDRKLTAEDSGNNQSDDDDIQILNTTPEGGDSETEIPKHEEENDQPTLRHRPLRKRSALKPKTKTHKKRLKASAAAQPKISEMFRVKEQTNGNSLKMVLVRKSDL